MPSFCCSDWVLFKEAKAPVFIIDGGVHIPTLESAKITYAGYFDPVADTSSALKNERAHSPAGRITEPYRACMKPAKVEQLTLVYFMIRKRAEADTRKQMEAMGSSSARRRRSSSP